MPLFAFHSRYLVYDEVYPLSLLILMAAAARRGDLGERDTREPRLLCLLELFVGLLAWIIECSWILLGRE